MARTGPRTMRSVSGVAGGVQEWGGGLNSVLISGALSPAVVSLEGRMYPVEICYLAEPVVDYVDAAVRTIFDIHLKVGLGVAGWRDAAVLICGIATQEPAGDVLVFMTGREEIDETLQEIADRIPS